ncbi:MAG: hypothetical protein JEZ06_04945 [Anaerolineaceae bacterium]|nr:hypothetical protein [Anaerolineaceae bacterium]
MNENKIWKESAQVKTYDGDFEGTWKPSSLFKTMLEAATRHANALGLGYDQLMDQKIVWVLSRIKIKFHHLPHIEEDIIIQTWPKCIDRKIFFMRDFLVTASDKRLLASATTAWLLVDIKNRRMLPVNKLTVPMPPTNEKFALDEMLDKVEIFDPAEEIFRFKSRYSDIDILGHVNSARYFEWVMNCFSLDYIKTHKIDALQINYVKEVKPAEEISILTSQDPENSYSWRISGINCSTNDKAFEAQIDWLDK